MRTLQRMPCLAKATKRHEFILWLGFACQLLDVLLVIAAKREIVQRAGSQALVGCEPCDNLGLKVELLTKFGENL